MKKGHTTTRVASPLIMMKILARKNPYWKIPVGKQAICNRTRPGRAAIQFLFNPFGRGRKLGLDAFLESLERFGLDHIGGGLRFEGNFFLGERIDTLAGLGGGLLDKGQLKETRNLENAGALLAELFLDEAVERVEECDNFLAALAGGIRNALHNARLGQRFGHEKKPLGI